MKWSVVMSSIVRFRSIPTPVKKSLRLEVQQAVQDSIRELPLLGEENPQAVFVIRHQIQDWRRPVPNGDGKRQEAQGEYRLAAELSRAARRNRHDATVRPFMRWKGFRKEPA
jgi:hypothetical protein